eukprot:PITA_25542
MADEAKIQLAILRLSSTALVWWESKLQSNKNVGKLFSSWPDFTSALKEQFYPLGYKQKALMNWQYLRQGKGQDVQSFTEEFRKQALNMSIALDTPEVVTKGKNERDDQSRKSPFKPPNGKSKAKWKGEEKKIAIAKEGERPYCNHCKKEGHNDNHCWKQHPENCPKKYGGKWKQKIVVAAQQELGSNLGDEPVITAARTKESLVKKLLLQTKQHSKPYPLGWIHDKAKLNVTQQCKVKFVIASKLVDEVELDVIPLDICGMVLGSPYLYYRKVVFFRHENKYQITKDGVEYIVRAHQNKFSVSFVTAGQMKRLVNSSKGCMLMVEQKGLPRKREIQHEIHLQHDAPLPNIGMYRMSAIKMEEIKRQVQELLDQGVIRPSTSLCGSPIVLVPKKDDTWRICVDYRVLNKITVKNHYPLPCIDDLLDQLKSVVYFTKLDLPSGYHQVKIAKQDVWKTTFKTKQVLFEWMLMPIGFCNTPTTFIQVMNDIVQPFIDDFVLVYLDDILVFSKSWSEHVCHVKKVLDVLKKEKLFVKLSKCEFAKTSLGYLGHIVGHGQLKIDPSKVEAIVNWPKPTIVTKVHRFLGAVQYWRRFIANSSVIAAPLHTLKSVKQVFQWRGRQQKSFETLKEKISTAPILALPNLQ